jgi:hypothetical protein
VQASTAQTISAKANIVSATSSSAPKSVFIISPY